MSYTADLIRPASAGTDSLDALINAARRAEQDGDLAEAERAYGRAIERIQAGEQPERGPQVLRWLGRIFYERGDYDQASGAFETSLVMAQKLDLRKDIAASLNSMAVVAQFRGRLDVAEVLYERAATMAAELEYPQLSALVDQNLGIIANIRGENP